MSLLVVLIIIIIILLFGAGGYVGRGLDLRQPRLWRRRLRHHRADPDRGADHGPPGPVLTSLPLRHQL